MFNIIAIIIATLLIQSLIMTVIVLISNNNENVAYICAGIFGLFLILIIGLGKLVYNYFKYNYFKQSIFADKDNNRFRCNPKYYYYLIWNSKNYKAITRYTDKQEWKGLPKISKTELQNYRDYKKKRRGFRHCNRHNI